MIRIRNEKIKFCLTISIIYNLFKKSISALSALIKHKRSLLIVL